MEGKRTRRSLGWLMPALFALLLAVSWSCKQPDRSAPAASGSPSSSEDQAELTRKIEEKAAEIDRKAEEIQNMQGTDEEKAAAVLELDKERRELQEMQDGGQ
jgi:hypothetical protein